MKPKNPAAVALGRLGGQSKSPAKLAAIAKNAKLGGWPKGKPRKPKPVKWTQTAPSHLTDDTTVKAVAVAMRRKAIKPKRKKGESTK